MEILAQGNEKKILIIVEVDHRMSFKIDLGYKPLN